MMVTHHGEWGEWIRVGDVCAKGEGQSTAARQVLVVEVVAGGAVAVPGHY